MAFQSRHRVNPAGGQKKEIAFPLSCEFQAAISAQKIRFHQIVPRRAKAHQRGGGGRAAVTGEHRRFGGTFEHQGKRAGREFLGMADVALHKFHARRLKPRQVQFRTAPVEIVHADDPRGRMAGFEIKREAAADEARSAGDQNAFWKGGTHSSGAAGGVDFLQNLAQTVAKFPDPGSAPEISARR